MDASRSPHRTAVVFAGGDPVDLSVVPPLPHGALLIAADGGLAQARRLGLTVDAVVGDMDSVDSEELDDAAASGAEIVRHLVDKDATDLELALAHAVAAGCPTIVVVGGLGGRIDHLLANASLLTTVPDGTTIEWWAGTARVSSVSGSRSFEREASSGDVVSLIPVGGPAVGVHTTGLRWRLDGDTLNSGSTRGISNRVLDTRFAVTIDEGVLLVVHYPEGTEP